jgi:hypothetical protein
LLTSFPPRGGASPDFSDFRPFPFSAADQSDSLDGGRDGPREEESHPSDDASPSSWALSERDSDCCAGGGSTCGTCGHPSRFPYGENGFTKQYQRVIPRSSIGAV